MRRVFSLAAIVGIAMVWGQVGFSDSAVAQESCMHCNFALAKCKRFNPTNADKCTAEKAACVKKCEATKASTAGASNRLKAEDSTKSKK